MITPSSASEFARYIKGAKPHGEWWSGHCPAHDDAHSSFSWADGENGRPVRIKCHAGCTRSEILAALGMEDPPTKVLAPLQNAEVVYCYYTVNGQYIAEKVRGYDSAGGRITSWRRQDGKGSYIKGRVKDELYLYGLPDLKSLKAGDTVYIAEGEKDVETLRKYGLIAVSGPDGAGHGKFPQEAIKWFEQKNVVIFQDNDKVGKEFAQEEAAAVSKVAASVKLIDLQEIWPDIPEHADISDYLQRFGTEMMSKVKNLIDNTPLWESSSKEQTTAATKFECFSAERILNEYIEPPQFIVQSLLAEGLTILVAPPKYGKSFLAMDLCCSVATGKTFLGFSTVQSKVLYLCLEDSKGRIKKRLKAVMNDNLVAQNLFFATEAPDMDNGLFDVLGKFLEENPECKLIIIDTLQKIIGASGGTDYNYYRDSQVGGKLKNFADSHHICLLVIHHTPKRRDENDPFNNISGTNGFAGAADTNIVLLRNERMEDITNMSISGRDVIETTYSIKFNKGTCLWEFQGNAAEIEDKFRRNQYETDDVVKAVKEAVALGKGTWRGTMSDLNGVALNAPDIGHLLGEPARLARHIKRLEDDLYLYDGISHTVIKNGSGGSPHVFTQANKDGFEKWQEVTCASPFDDPPDSDKPAESSTVDTVDDR